MNQTQFIVPINFKYLELTNVFNHKVIFSVNNTAPTNILVVDSKSASKEWIDGLLQDDNFNYSIVSLQLDKWNLSCEFGICVNTNMKGTKLVSSKKNNCYQYKKQYNKYETDIGDPNVTLAHPIKLVLYNLSNKILSTCKYPNKIHNFNCTYYEMGITETNLYHNHYINCHNGNDKVQLINRATNGSQLTIPYFQFDNVNSKNDVTMITADTNYDNQTFGIIGFNVTSKLVIKNSTIDTLVVNVLTNGQLMLTNCTVGRLELFVHSNVFLVALDGCTVDHYESSIGVVGKYEDVIIHVGTINNPYGFRYRNCTFGTFIRSISDNVNLSELPDTQTTITNSAQIISNVRKCDARITIDIAKPIQVNSMINAVIAIMSSSHIYSGIKRIKLDFSSLVIRNISIRIVEYDTLTTILLPSLVNSDYVNLYYRLEPNEYLAKRLKNKYEKAQSSIFTVSSSIETSKLTVDIDNAGMDDAKFVNTIKALEYHVNLPNNKLTSFDFTSMLSNPSSVFNLYNNQITTVSYGNLQLEGIVACGVLNNPNINLGSNNLPTALYESLSKFNLSNSFIQKLCDSTNMSFIVDESYCDSEIDLSDCCFDSLTLTDSCKISVVKLDRCSANDIDLLRVPIKELSMNGVDARVWYDRSQVGKIVCIKSSPLKEVLSNSHCNLTQLDISGNAEIIDGKLQMFKLELQNNNYPLLQSLTIRNMYLDSLDTQEFEGITQLNLINCMIISLTVSNNVSLTIDRTHIASLQKISASDVKGVKYHARNIEESNVYLSYLN